MPIWPVALLVAGAMSPGVGWTLGAAWACAGFAAAVGLAVLVSLLVGWRVTRRRVGWLYGVQQALPWLGVALAAWIGWGGVPVALAGVMAVAWAGYPVDRRLREAAVIRSLDRGEALCPPISRGAYLGQWWRLRVLLSGLPAGLVIAWAEGASHFHAPLGIVVAGSLLLVVGVLPRVVRGVVGAKPLAPGETRTALLALAARHGVPLKQLWLWPTQGQLVNAAVVGLTPWGRSLLLTDGLLERLPREQVDAVLLHELGHVRGRHVLLLMLLGSLMAMGVDALWRGYGVWGLLSLPVAVGLMGGVMRGCERQADAFSARALGDPRPLIEALRAVARHSGVDERKGSFRHGSVARRIAALSRL